MCQATAKLDKTASYHDKREQALLLVTREVINLVLKGLGSVDKAELEAAVRAKIENFKRPMRWECWTLSAEDIDTVYEERLTGPPITDEEYEDIAGYFRSAAECDLGEMWEEYIADAILQEVDGAEYKEENATS